MGFTEYISALHPFFKGYYNPLVIVFDDVESVLHPFFKGYYNKINMERKVFFSVLHTFFKGYYNINWPLWYSIGVYYTPFLRGITDSIHITIKGKKAT